MDENRAPKREPENGGKQPNKGPKNRQSLFMFVMMCCVVMLAWTYFSGNGKGASSKEITYTEFLDMVEDGTIASVEIQGQELEITPKAKLSENTRLSYYTYKLESNDRIVERLEEAGIKNVNGITPDTTVSIIVELISIILPLAIIWIAMGFLMRRMGSGSGVMGVGKNKAKVYIQKQTGILFKDVAGQDEAKESLQEMVDFLHNPEKYTEIGAKLPKGALLVGPPGTGKTLLAKAVAGEAKVPFFSLSGSDFVEMFVGVGASRVRDLFEEAKKNAPCIIFIDEIDAIGKRRDSHFGGNDEREQTLNQLLAEMDGFESNKACLVLGATNRPEVLDQALLRPGRFDRRVIVDKPDLKGRVDVLKVHAKNVHLDDTVDLEAIGLATSGAVGSDLANMINEAAILAVKHGRSAVSQKDLFEAVEVVLVGKEKKDRVMKPEERRIVSYHEVGHALVSALQKNSEPVQKITIVPRTMGALGYVMHVPEEEKYLNTEAELRDMLVGLVAGRAAEEVVFDTVTTGAANDIEKATEIARSMVTRYGMSKKFGLVGLATVESKYLDGRAALNCSDTTAADIDAEVIAILKESYDKALELLRDNRDVMDKLAEFLIEKETITGKEFMAIFRKEKGLPDPDEEKKETTDSTEAGDAQEVDEITEECNVQTTDVVSEASLGQSVDITVGEDDNKPSEPDKNVGVFSHGKID